MIEAVPKHEKVPAIKWYKELDVNQKVSLKEVFVLLCGMEWHDLSGLFTFTDKITIAYNKMKIEGFDL